MLTGKYLSHWMLLVGAIYILLETDGSVGCLTAERSLEMFVFVSFV